MEALFIYLLKSVGVLAIFFLAYKFLLQKETFFALNRHYLLAGIMASILLPFVVFISYIYVDPIPVQELSFTEIPYTINELPVETFNWNTLFFNLYMLGVIIVGVQFILQLISLFRIIKTGTLKEFNAFKLVEVTQDVSPFSFFNYIIYNPNNFSEKDLQIILNHEKAHGKQLHSIDILLAQLLVIFQWFNPIVWLYKKTIQQNLEFMADKAAISTIDSMKNYQRTLLKVSVAPYCTSITNNFYNSLIKKRIVMLNQSSSKTRNLWKYSLILPALALFLVSFNTKTVEIIKESDTAPKEPLSESVFNEFDQLVLNKTPIETLIPLNVPSKRTAEILTASQDNEVIVKITKNTSKEELEQIEKDLKAKGMEFSYSNVKFNSNGEITRIKIRYKDKSTGNIGMYNVAGDDDEPINDIFIYKTEGGGIGLGNSPDGKEHKMRMAEREERMKEHEKRAKVHKERAYELQVRMKEHNKQLKEHHEERIEEHRERIKERQVHIEKEHEERIEHMEERRAKMHEEREEHMEHIEESRAKMKEKREEIRMRIKEGDSLAFRVHDKNSNTFVFKTSSESPARINLHRGEDVIYFVDGEEIDEKHVKTIDADRIASVDVLKGDSAIKVYGDKGKDGVVKIITKTGHGDSEHNTIVYEDVHFDSDSDVHSGTVYFVKKTTSDANLKSFKAKLKKQNVTVKFGKIKRDNSGNITRIKIELSDSNGNKSSSTFNTEPDGIPTIMIGKKGTKLIVSSNY